MLRRISEHHDATLLRSIDLRTLLDAAPRTGQSLPSLSLGRHPSNDVVLQSSGIPLLLSRFHSLITYDGEQYTVVDRSNTNGTYVNSVQLPHLGQRTLRAGDILSFGGPANVLREGITLRNPFRFLFEEPPRPALMQPQPHENLPWAQGQSPPDTTQRLPRGAAAAAPAEGVGAEAASGGAAAAAAGASESGRRKRARGSGGGGAAAGAPPDEPEPQRRVSRRSRATPPRPAVAPVEPVEPQEDAAPAPAPAPEPVVPVAPLPLPPSPPAPDADQAPLPSLTPRRAAPLESEDILSVSARLAAEGKCSICFELMVAPHALSCAHSFCGACIFTWMKKSPCCPCCRARSAKPAYERALDDILSCVVEPRLEPGEMEERQRRKHEWAAMHRESVRAEREAVAARGPEADSFERIRAAIERLPYTHLHRILRQSQAQLQAEMSLLQARFVTAAGGGAEGAPAPAHLRSLSVAHARAVAAAGLPAEAPPPPVTLAWRVEAARDGHSICHSCFRSVEVQQLRTVHVTMQPPWADLLAAGMSDAHSLRSFFHLGCKAPECRIEEVQGVEALTAEQRAQLDQALSRRDAALAVAAPVHAREAAGPGRDEGLVSDEGFAGF